MREKEEGVPARRRATATSAFGVSRRESHDASAFYSRFSLPVISNDGDVAAPAEFDVVYHEDARDMSRVADGSIALVVTSPPYFAGKEYEAALGEGHVPGTYMEYLQLLEDVFEQCARKLEPGGRIAVNVANLGRKPYRSLAADVIDVLGRLGLLLRGEIIWQKGRGAAGSCAWGSFQSPANPVLRDVTERIVVASKGRFDRAGTGRARAEKGLPSEPTISKDEFMEATLDLWDMAPESATRVGHPAPFPVELPGRLIELYTYKHDLVMDPFMGSGTTAIAALQKERHYVGYEIDAGYYERCVARIETERLRLDGVHARAGSPPETVPSRPGPAPEDLPFQLRSNREGKRAKELARDVLTACGFAIDRENVRFAGGVEVNFEAKDAKGRRWLFDVSGAFTSNRPGLRRTDTLWKGLGRAAVLKTAGGRDHRLVLLSTDLPPVGSAGDTALRAVRGATYHDAIEMLSRAGQQRLTRYASGDGWDAPIDELLPPEPR